jgi:hypothetical protein
MTADVDMADPSSKEQVKDGKTEEEAKPTGPVLEEVLDANLKLIDKAVATREARLLFGRILRQTATVRGQFSSERLSKFIDNTLDGDSSIKPFLLQTAAGEGQVRTSSPTLALDLLSLGTSNACSTSLIIARDSH